MLLSDLAIGLSLLFQWQNWFGDFVFFLFSSDFFARISVSLEHDFSLSSVTSIRGRCMFPSLLFFCSYPMFS
jgi:hypothetical protein